ncbi:Uncharacterised protein [Staphylococcus aureus]|nr:Uncharacterised protein [Staphylococcus aureus]
MLPLGADMLANCFPLLLDTAVPSNARSEPSLPLLTVPLCAGNNTTLLGAGCFAGSITLSLPIGCASLPDSLPLLLCCPLAGCSLTAGLPNNIRCGSVVSYLAKLAVFK